MKIQFDTLLEVKIFHNYYMKGISKDFMIEPTHMCQNQLRNYGLLFKKTAEGFKILYEVVEDISGNPHPLKPLEESLKFTFLLKSKNPYLINYSSLPFDNRSDKIYYFHNVSDNQQNDHLLLTSDITAEYVSKKDRICLKSQFFKYNLARFELTEYSFNKLEQEDLPPNILAKLEQLENKKYFEENDFIAALKKVIEESQAVNYKEKILEHATQFGPNDSIVDIEIFNEQSKLVLKKMIQIKENELNCSIDLREQPPGKFYVTIDGTEQFQFYANDELKGKTVFGIIDLFRNDNIPLHYQFPIAVPADERKVDYTTYSIKIDNRKTFWKYYLVLKYFLKNFTPDDWPGTWPDYWSIKNSFVTSNDIVAHSEQLYTLTDGSIVVPFISNKKMPLQQEVIKGIQLIRKNNNGDSSGISRIDNLPNPSFKSINRSNNKDDNELYSEIFVYL